MKMKLFTTTAFNLKSVVMATALVFASFGLFSCSSDDDDDDDNDSIAETYNFESTSTDAEEWVYFSFAEGKEITVDKSKPEESTAWDIAFQRFYVRTNSGTSGKGKGGVLDTGKKNFEEVISVPASGFTVDEKFQMMTTMGKYEERSGSKAFKVKDSFSWAWFVYTEMTWYYNNNVFIIRTADGKNYAKIIMKSYKNDADKSGYITFEYVYPFK